MLANKKSSIIKLIAIAVVLVIAFMLSNGLNSYYMTLINMTLIYFVCTASMSLIFGMGPGTAFASPCEAL